MGAEPHGLPSQAGFSHVRHAPSTSPPVGNGVVPYHPRQHTPQPQIGSRPASRNNVHRQGQNLVPHQVTHGPPAPNGYASYMPNPNVYNPHAPPGMPGGQHPGQQQPPQFQYQQAQQHPPPQQQQSYLQENRRQSMPPAFPQNDRPQSLQHLQPNQQPHLQRHSPSPPHRQDNLLPVQPKPLPMSKSRSIFTPIDDQGSVLARQWDFTSSSVPDIKQEKDRSHSVDLTSVQRNNSSIPSPPAPQSRPNRVLSQPTRTSTLNSIPGDSKRPRLKVQIPSDHEDDNGSGTAGSSPRQSGDTANETARGTETSHSSGVVLPPPSPSASALLSAGAQGPPNPFARPLPPSNGVNGSAYGSNNNIETPMSALPSRFMGELLPSPSSFYPEWGFGRSGGDSAMLPSPLNFQTPIVGTGPSFSRDDDTDRKRKSPEGESHPEASNVKRVKA